MKHTVLIAAMLLALAGCNAPDPQAQNEVAAPPAETMVAETPAAPCPEQTGYNPFPAGLTLAFPYHLRSDRIYVHTTGQERRRVTVEYLEGDATTVMVQVDQAMKDAGFKARPPAEETPGKSVATYTKKGTGTAYVTLVAAPGAKPSHPRAAGTVEFNYPIGAAPAASGD